MSWFITLIENDYTDSIVGFGRLLHATLRLALGLWSGGDGADSLPGLRTIFAPWIPFGMVKLGWV